MMLETVCLSKEDELGPGAPGGCAGVRAGQHSCEWSLRARGDRLASPGHKLWVTLSDTIIQSLSSSFYLLAGLGRADLFRKRALGGRAPDHLQVNAGPRPLPEAGHQECILTHGLSQEPGHMGVGWGGGPALGQPPSWAL